MRDPKRILGKVLKSNENLDLFEKTGEPLEQLVEVLRNIIRCRRTRQWISDNYQVDLIVSPKTFTRLLDIPQINFIENSNRMLEVDTVSLKEIRNSDDPVTIGNLNSLLKAFYRNLESIEGRLKNDHPDPSLIREMRGEWIVPVTEQINTLKKFHGKITGYLLSLSKVKSIDYSFEKRFPGSIRAHPLRKNWLTVERELEFYRKCHEMNELWEATGFDLFRVLRSNGLSNLIENVQEMGNLLWNIVYNRKSVEHCLDMIGIDFNDARSVFDPTLVKLNNV